MDEKKQKRLYKEGDRVYHIIYGRAGVVTMDQDDETVRVLFDGTAMSINYPEKSLRLESEKNQ